MLKKDTMLTKRDIQMIREALKEDFLTQEKLKEDFQTRREAEKTFVTQKTLKEVLITPEEMKKTFVTQEKLKEDFPTREETARTYVTREDLAAQMAQMRNDILQFKDDILWEIKGIRQDLAITIGYRGAIADHETRLERLERHEEYRRLASFKKPKKA